MQISYLVTMEQALNYLSNQGLEAASNVDYENNVKIYRLAAHDAICKYLGYEIVSTTYTDERLSGTSGYELYLRHRPITDVTAVKIDDVTQTVSDYEIIDEKLLYNSNGIYKGLYNYKVSYVAGYTQSTMPNDIREKALELIALYSSKNGGGGTTVGKSSISDGQGGSESINPEAEREILESLQGYQKLW